MQRLFPSQLSASRAREASQPVFPRPSVGTHLRLSHGYCSTGTWCFLCTGTKASVLHRNYRPARYRPPSTRVFVWKVRLGSIRRAARKRGKNGREKVVGRKGWWLSLMQVLHFPRGSRGSESGEEVRR
ncbi:uncharacterized protein LOC111049500 [Nilaparvata lugens]|uniref:uncharacterized protein LOC111049500 n=1 Tax=Nilaparvata lugens TaxID=108931 RepID=UPI00193D9474|nr:uncharacterized protein LOC111049500 [Nilaparvata lugens]